MDVYRVPTSNHLSFLFHQKENISSLTWVGHRINTVISWMKEKLLVAQWCLTHCDPMDYSPQAPLFKEFSRQDYRSWFPFPPPGDLPNQGSNLSLPNCRQIVYHLSYQGSPSIVNEVKWSEVTQSCLSLCSPMDCSLQGFSVHGIFQARVLAWVAISFSRGSSRPRLRTRVSHIAGRHFTIWATRETWWHINVGIC